MPTVFLAALGPAHGFVTDNKTVTLFDTQGDEGCNTNNYHGRLYHRYSLGAAYGIPERFVKPAGSPWSENRHVSQRLSLSFSTH